MQVIRTEVEIACGHRLQLHDGKCKRLHGHNYRIEVWIEGAPAENGMIQDFGVIKPGIKQCLAKYDHRMILYKGDPMVALFKDHTDHIVLVDFAPSAENLAKLWYEDMIAGVTSAINKVRVWETGDNYAEYSA